MGRKVTPPVVSIGVPVYNGEKYLDECLNSIMSQDFEDWECVIVNNSSTDRTAEIARRFVASDPRFRLEETDHLLPVDENWNYCYSVSNHGSKYFKIVPADDLLFPRFLSEMVEVLDKYPNAGFASSYIIDDTDVSCGGLDMMQGQVFPGQEILLKHLRGEMLVFGSANAVLYRTEHLKKLSEFPVIFQKDTFHFDTYLCYRLLSLSDLGFVFQVLSYTRRHHETITQNVANRMQTGYFFKERALYDFKYLDSGLEKYYKRHRSLYAHFYLKSRLDFHKSRAKWHREHIQRPFALHEYLIGFFRTLYLFIK